MLILRPRMLHIWSFLDCFSFSLFFGHFLLYLYFKTKTDKLWTKFWIEDIKFLPCSWPSFLLCIKQLEQISCVFSKNLRNIAPSNPFLWTLRFNETKVSLRNAFIDNLFTIKCDKESKYDKETLFSGFLGIIDLIVNS